MVLVPLVVLVVVPSSLLLSPPPCCCPLLLVVVPSLAVVPCSSSSGPPSHPVPLLSWSAPASPPTSSCSQWHGWVLGCGQPHWSPCWCPVLLVVVPSSLSSCCHHPVIVLVAVLIPLVIPWSSSLASLSSPHPHHVRCCPLIPGIVPLLCWSLWSPHLCLHPRPSHALVLVIGSLSCSLSPVAPTVHPVSSGSQQWGWVLGHFVIVIVLLLFLVFWSLSRCRVPHLPIPLLSPPPHPAAPCFHPASSGSQAWLGALCQWWCLSHHRPVTVVVLGAEVVVVIIVPSLLSSLSPHRCHPCPLTVVIPVPSLLSSLSPHQCDPCPLTGVIPVPSPVSPLFPRHRCHPCSLTIVIPIPSPPSCPIV